MADYKRLVSYIYNYDSGIRQKNVGFSRVESKNGQCKVTIHITASLSSQESLKVYLFRRTGSQMEGIYFGDMNVKNGTGDFKVETNTYSLMGSPYSLEDISGVLLLVNKAKFFGSQWDDEPIQINNFFVYDAKKREEERVDRLVKDIHVEPQNVNEMIMEEELASRVNEPEGDASLRAANIQGDSLANEAVISAVDSIKSSFQEKDQAKSEEILPDEVSGQSINQEADARWNSVEEMETEGVKSTAFEEEEQSVSAGQPARIEWGTAETASTIASPKNEEEPVIEAESLGGSCCCSENYPDCVRQILRSFPAVKPFPSSSPESWVRIEPKDIGMLPVETWILANNSFLLHGYYNYRHLIFGVLQRGEMTQYVIGVPGVLQNTEQTMAELFGFHRFLSANIGEPEQGSFGYWIQQVVL